MQNITKWFLIVIILLPMAAFSQQVSLFEQFNGQIDYVSFGNTLNKSENSVNSMCEIETTSRANLRLQAGQTIEKALLYWAGSNSNGDFEVKLNGIDVIAEREFFLDFSGLTYFAAYADVTSIVQGGGQGNYILSDFDIQDDLADYCPGTNFGGWAITVIYEDLLLPINQISIYDGLEAVSSTNTQLNIKLTGLNVVSDELARIGFLAWEGDSGIAINESLRINGNLISNALNPSTNAFNGTNSYTNRSDLYNMDLDFYNIEGVVTAGDTEIDIQLTSGQDFVMINNVITSVNSESPDATITLDNVTRASCLNRDIDVDYTVFNTNSTSDLPIGTPIAFFVEDILLGVTATSSIIEIDGSESGMVTLTIPNTAPTQGLLRAIVDDDGSGVGIVSELNENNNEAQQQLILGFDVIPIQPYVICEEPFDGEAEFDLTIVGNEFLGGLDPTIFRVSYYLDRTQAENQNSPIPNPENFPNTTNPQTIYIGVLDTRNGCYFGGEQIFEVEVIETPTAFTPKPYEICDNEGANDGFATFDLLNPTFQNDILQGQPFEIIFYETIEDAQMGGDNQLPDLYRSNSKKIFTRLVAVGFTDPESTCVAVGESELVVNRLVEITLDESYRLCVDSANSPIMEEEGVGSPPVIDTGLDPDLYTFQWFLDGQILANETGSTLTALLPGIYSVVITENETGCSNTFETTVTVSSPPLTFDAQVSTSAFSNNHMIEATAGGLGSYVFSLDDGAFQESGTFEDVMPGVRKITVKDANGCGSITFNVSVVDFPKFFTPNQDGFNDTWNIIEIVSIDPSAKIYIFDRFGKLIKQLDPAGTGWNGTFNGSLLPSNDYWFRVEYKENNEEKEMKGHFTLKR